MKAIIVGGGIGGLTMALMLHARGIDCEIFEQSEQIRELGVGINTLPHAIKELAEIGLLPALDRVGIRTHELFYMNRMGQEIWREPRGTDAGFEYPQFSIHRGRLQALIYQAVRARIGESRIHTGHRLGSFTQDDAGVTAYFFAREGGHRATARGDILIGADGIHSYVRERLYPNEGPARWNGTILWRGAMDWPKYLTGRSMVIAGGMAAKLVVYPIGEGAREDRPLTNWAVMVKVAAGGVPPKKEDWSRLGRFEDLMPHVQRFHIPFVDAKAMIEATPEFWEYPLCDRDPLPHWSHGRVTLLGDAAHPMYPVGSNGASQAILDARCLADRLRSAEHVGQALYEYERERLPLTAQIVQSNRSGGPEGVIDAVEARAPDGFDNIEAVLSYEQRKAIVRGYAAKAGFAKEQVNKQPLGPPANAA
jgi:2-polyprenyl-6-methoxyphenol hydroxylase-like FAD-dependent oxidoreductase